MTGFACPALGADHIPCLDGFFMVDIDGKTEVMTVTLKDVSDTALWSVDLVPSPDARPGRLVAQHI